MSRPAITHWHLARMTPARAERGIDRRLGRDVAPAEILGQRAADRVRGRAPARAARTAPTSWLRLRTGSSGASSTSTCRVSAMPVSRRSISPDARRSRSTSARSASCASGARTIARATGVFSGCCPSDFFFRIVAEHRRREFQRRDRADRPRPLVGTTRATSSAYGHAARWTDPSLPPRPDLLGHERQEGREQPQQGRERGEQGAVGRGRRLRPLVAVAPALHELEIVVAEATRRTFRCARAPGRSL